MRAHKHTAHCIAVDLDRRAQQTISTLFVVVVSVVWREGDEPSDDNDERPSSMTLFSSALVVVLSTCIIHIMPVLPQALSLKANVNEGVFGPFDNVVTMVALCAALRLASHKQGQSVPFSISCRISKSW